MTTKSTISAKARVAVLDFLEEEEASSTAEDDLPITRWATEQTVARLRENDKLRRGRAPIRRRPTIRDKTVLTLFLLPAVQK